MSNIAIIGTLDASDKLGTTADLLKQLLSDVITTDKHTIDVYSYKKSDTIEYDNYGYVFCLLESGKLSDKESVVNVIRVGKNISNSCYLFVVVDLDTSVHLNDEDVLVPTSAALAKSYNKVISVIGEKLTSGSLDVAYCPINIRATHCIRKSSLEEDSEIDLLAGCILDAKKGATEKRKEIRSLVKKDTLKDYLFETGWMFLEQLCRVSVTHCVDADVEVTPPKLTVKHLEEIKLDVDDASSFERLREVMKNLDVPQEESGHKKIVTVFKTKFEEYKDKCKIHLTFKPEKANSIDVNRYYKTLCDIEEIALMRDDIKGLSDLTKDTAVIKTTITSIEELIASHNEKLKVISGAEKSEETTEVDRLWKKLVTPETLKNRSADSGYWCDVLTQLHKAGAESTVLEKLVESLVTEKIVAPPNPIYPHCLSAFLLINMRKHFVFLKIQMFLSYKMHTINSEGNCKPEMFRDLTSQTYHELLLVEHRFLDLVANPEVNIVATEVYNEDKKGTKTKDDDNVKEVKKEVKKEVTEKKKDVTEKKKDVKKKTAKETDSEETGESHSDSSSEESDESSESEKMPKKTASKKASA